MFDSLAGRISKIFDKLRGSGVLKEADVDAALREIRIALLEADVALDVAKKFIADVKEKAIGQNVIKSVSPAQLVVKIVYDELVALLGSSSPFNITHKPYKLMLVGLQGAGKTTTAAKIAKKCAPKKVLLGSTDIYRPAAIEQLRVLADRVSNADFVEENENMSCAQILSQIENNTPGHDVVILDTAGRLHIDEIKMNELQEIAEKFVPNDIFLVADIMTGQDAINIAQKFSETLDITGVVLTRTDGDARGGVALSMKSLTQCDIKFLCTGEGLDDIAKFDAERVANRILGMGDIVSLVEKAQAAFSQEEVEMEQKRLMSGDMTLDDFAKYLEKMSKMGSVKEIVKMLPKSDMIESAMSASGFSDKTIAREIAILRSMTKKERSNYKILNGSRRRRIAQGSGTSVPEVNKVIKQYEGLRNFYKQIRKMGGLEKIMRMVTK